MDNSFIKESILEILDCIEEGIHIIDKSGDIVYYNSFAREIDGIDPGESLGKHLLEIYPSLDELTSTLLTAIRTGEPIYNKEQTFLNYKGKKITTINSSIPLKKDGKVLGALEISKDITNVREMSEKIVDLQSKLYRSKRNKKTEDNAIYTFEDIIGKSREIIKLKAMARKAAQSDATVLVSGDTGTGKELFIHAIHNGSKRRHAPFIAQNCAALPVGLLEGILFGTAKGGFTGADDRPGLFELANGGTLFLDEINSMPIELQSKLLRVLQDGVVRRVGGINSINVDIRIMAATNMLPEEAVENKQLRKDLYYRLNVINIHIPALRERKDDIEILTKHFINKFNEKLNKKVIGISNEVLEIFKDYYWEGNVRELEHLIEGIMNMENAYLIDIEHLPQKMLKKYTEKKENGSSLSLREVLEQTEKNLIQDALKRCDHNITHAAELLQIPRQTLQYRVLKLKL